MMKKVLFPLIVISVLLLILGCSTTSEKMLINEGNQAQNGDQIRSILSGNTLNFTVKGISGVIYFSPDGTQ